MPLRPPEAQLSRLLREAQAEHRLPSVSAALRVRGEIVWEEAFGVAEATSGREATPDTQYRIGSITKTFTAAAVLALCAEGRLGLDDPLAVHVPQAASFDLSLRRLLAHSSGLQREPPGEIWETLDFPDTAELLARLREAEQVLEPGSHWHYSNLAYALLGEVVARVSGAPCTDVVAERFLRPLGLRRTTWLRAEPAARGYYVDPFADVLRPEAEIERVGATSPAGDLWSTAADLCRWAGWLASREEMHAVQVMAEPERWTLAWGLGLQLHRRGDRILFGHGGAMPGFLAGLAGSRREGVAAAVLTNASTPPFAVGELSLDLAEKAIELYPREPDLWRPGEEPPEAIRALLGIWWSEGLEWVFRWRSGRLQAARADGPPGAEPSVFEPDGPDRFRTVAGEERGEPLVVVRDESGTVVKLSWATYPFTREPRVFGPSA